MSEANHTPGPWIVREVFVDKSDIIRPDFPSGHAIATVDHWSDESRKADARLIAAAPDLLAALEQALRESGCDGDLCAYPWHDSARAAIAKAKEGVQ